MAIIYTESYKVNISDIDENNHMNNVRYVELVQEITKQHWLKLIKGYNYNEEYYWVVLNHNIDFRSSALLNDELIIETYVEKLEGVYSYRRVIIKHKDTEKVCMNALTKWCLINADNQRISRIPQAFYDLMLEQDA